MSMHLEGPWLSTTGKRKGKVKFRNAEEARKARELEESWKALQQKLGVEADEKRRNRGLNSAPMSAPVRNHRMTNAAKIPSLPFTGGPCTKAPDKVYTGDAIVGIGTLHKSNAVPIFSRKEATEISSMRR